MRAVLIEPDMSGGGARVFDMAVTVRNLMEVLGGDPATVPLRSPVPATGYINESAKRYELPTNAVATEIAHIRDGDYIAGRLLVLGGIDAEGNDTSVSDELLLWLLEAHEAKELNYLRGRVRRLGSLDPEYVDVCSRQELIGELVRAGMAA